MTCTSPLKLVSGEKSPRPIQPDMVDDDEEFILSLPDGVAEGLAENVGNKGPATPPARPLLGRLRDWLGRKH